jgi:hypothetical protein
MIDLGTGNNNKINWALKDKHWHCGDCVQGCPEGPWSGDCSKGLLHQVPLLSHLCWLLLCNFWSTMLGKWQLDLCPTPGFLLLGVG